MKIKQLDIEYGRSASFEKKTKLFLWVTVPKMSQRGRPIENAWTLYTKTQAHIILLVSIEYASHRHQAGQ